LLLLCTFDFIVGTGEESIAEVNQKIDVLLRRPWHCKERDEASPVPVVLLNPLIDELNIVVQLRTKLPAVEYLQICLVLRRELEPFPRTL
jgi:hypothetical protein